MKSLKPQNIAVEDYKKRNFQEVDANDAGDFHQSTLLPNMPQRILSANVLKLQRMIGNKAVQRLLISRMANATVVQRESTEIANSDERIASCTSNDGVLTITLNDAEAINAKIKVTGVIDKSSTKTEIDIDHITPEPNGKSVKITVDLNQAKIDGDVDLTKIIYVTYRIESGGTSDDVGEQQEDTNSNGKDNSTSKEFPPPKTEEDFTDEEADEEYLKADKADLIKEILRIGQEKVDNDDWDILPHNFKETRLSSLEIPQLKKLLAETKGSSDYQQVQNFLSNL